MGRWRKQPRRGGQVKGWRRRKRRRKEAMRTARRKGLQASAARRRSAGVGRRRKTSRSRSSPRTAMVAAPGAMWRAGSRLTNLLLHASPAAAAATRRVVEGGDFALSFLPGRASSYAADQWDAFYSYAVQWKVLDCRNGRLLLRNQMSREMAVADPLTRRCVALPAPPAQRPVVGYGLVADDGDSSLFHAFCISQDGGSSGLRALVLSSGELRWTDAAGLALEHQSDLADSRAMQANGSLYWGLKGWDRMVELNTVTMEFSVLELPPFARKFRFDVIEKGEDGAGGTYLLTMREFCIEVWGGWEDGSGRLTWTLVEKSVRFQRAMEAMIGSEHSHRRGLHCIGVVAGVLFFLNGDLLLSIDLETMRLRMLSHIQKCGKGPLPSGLIYPYTIAWPPSFLNPTDESA